jgi:hypothetical protein
VILTDKGAHADHGTRVANLDDPARGAIIFANRLMPFNRACSLWLCGASRIIATAISHIAAQSPTRSRQGQRLFDDPRLDFVRPLAP